MFFNLLLGQEPGHFLSIFAQHSIMTLLTAQEAYGQRAGAGPSNSCRPK